MKLRELLIACGLVTVLAACPAPTSSAPPPAQPTTSEPTTPPSTTTPTTPTTNAPADPAVPTDHMTGLPPAAMGAACTSNKDCGPDGVCEGEGCGADRPGVCRQAQRACTRDLRAYCGCDGVTFQASGSCPGRRYASKGACSAAAP